MMPFPHLPWTIWSSQIRLAGGLEARKKSKMLRRISRLYVFFYTQAFSNRSLGVESCSFGLKRCDNPPRWRVRMCPWEERLNQEEKLAWSNGSVMPGQASPFHTRAGACQSGCQPTGEGCLIRGSMRLGRVRRGPHKRRSCMLCAARNCVNNLRCIPPPARFGKKIPFFSSNPLDMVAHRSASLVP
jgi:hypothetical protein